MTRRLLSSAVVLSAAMLFAALVKTQTAGSPTTTIKATTAAPALSAVATSPATPGLSWRRCPVGQVWIDNKCSGTAALQTWDQAKASCEADGFRLPGPSEFKALLSGCVDPGQGGGARKVQCNSCAESTACRALFGSDTGIYWTMEQQSVPPNGCASGDCPYHFIMQMALGDSDVHGSKVKDLVRCVK